MVYGIVQWVIISLILILLVHHLFSFLTNTLTVPKVKDLVQKPSKLYKEIEETLISSNNKTIQESSNNNNQNLNTKEMKLELKNFFNELSQSKQSSSPEIGNFSKNLYSEI
uniref:Uncharacterized protein n=1 Tax=viral metagenome TaxID=1070528 RepID=A0A6C0AXL5_9ZZZZ|tara:strand:- start:410 stop:742 length:333 start_codon:yes stop_codon:yes gene_type:complete